MTALWRLLASIAVGVAHFVFTLMLGSNVHCDNVRGCPDTDWVQPPTMDLFVLPLSLARDWLGPVFADWSFAKYSMINSLAFGVVVWIVLWVYAWARGRIQGGR